jgi:hypothetical protein
LNLLLNHSLTSLGDYKIAVADMNGDYLDDIVSVSSTKIDLLLQQPDGTFVPTSDNDYRCTVFTFLEYGHW